MIIFGFGKRTIKELGTTEQIRCGHCGNIRNWTYKKVTTWFTLFFIPVIPYNFLYVKECPICRSYAKIDKSEAEGAVGNGLAAPEDDGLTDVQRNYKKQMEEFNKEKE